MKGISVKQAAEIVGGKLIGIGNFDSEITGLVIDSRNVKSGFAFAAIKGEHVDGHDYVEKAFALGASCCIVEKNVPETNGCLIKVESTPKAMAKLAEAYRKMLRIPVIGITGSVGKTTAKEMISSVLSQHYNVLKTDKNLNNELGVPLTIFRIEPEHEAAVIEMGISDFNEMSRLAQMVRPTDAVYTLIGNAHLDRLSNRQGVFKAKTEMLDYMPDDGTVFLNADDDMLCKCECRQNKIFYGLCDNADVRAENLATENSSVQTCDIVSGSRRLHVSIPAYGHHMVYAALEGAAVGIKYGLSDDEIIRGIASYETVGRRANVIDTGYITIIDDCYNANPDSVKCAIDSMSDRAGRKVCILGDMLEMGTARAELHADIGRYAVSHGVDLLLCVGEMSENTALAAKSIEAKHFNSNSELISALPSLIRKGDTVLVKASHSMKLEEVSDALKIMK
jgi:UDP-N-acetylmuramoyl-tripeptide--D-alanyl-D-alanine ligase